MEISKAFHMTFLLNENFFLTGHLFRLWMMPKFDNHFRMIEGDHSAYEAAAAAFCSDFVVFDERTEKFFMFIGLKWV